MDIVLLFRRSALQTQIAADLNRSQKAMTQEVFVMEYKVGQIVRLRKKHPCGSEEWEILRVGADFRLKCLGCGHQIMVPRKMVEKNTRGLRDPDT